MPRVPELPTRSRRSLVRTGLAIWGLTWGCAGCVVAPPTAAEVLAAGFRTPEQTFRTFQTASAGNLAELEYRCLSIGFRDREGLSKLAYLEFREDWLRSRPLLRWGLDRAHVVAVEPLDETRCRLWARSWRVTLAVELVREEFYEYWTPEGLVDSADLDLARATRVVEDAGGWRWLQAAAPLPEGLDPADLATFCVRREWKIDAFRLAEGLPEHLRSAEHADPAADAP